MTGFPNSLPEDSLNSQYFDLKIGSKDQCQIVYRTTTMFLKTPFVPALNRN